MSTRAPIQRKKSAQPERDDLPRVNQAAVPTAQAVPAALNDGLSSAGQALDGDTREQMESQFGHDFSQVRVHADDRAAASAQALDAQAYTHGSDIVFGAGEYTPDTPGGQHLIAHELAHVVQQTHEPIAGSPVAPGLVLNHPDDGYEQAADQAADQAVMRQPTTTPEAIAPLVSPITPFSGSESAATPPAIQRKAAGGDKPETLEDAIARAQQDMSESDAEQEEAEIDLPEEAVDLEAPTDAAAYGIDEEGEGGAADAPPAEEEESATARPPDAAAPATAPAVSAETKPATEQPAGPPNGKAAPIKPEALLTMPQAPRSTAPDASPASTADTDTVGDADMSTPATDTVTTDETLAEPGMDATDMPAADTGMARADWQPSEMPLPDEASGSPLSRHDAGESDAPAAPAPAQEDPAPSAEAAPAEEPAPAETPEPQAETSAAAPAASQKEQTAAAPTPPAGNGAAAAGAPAGGGAAGGAAPMLASGGGGGGGGGMAPASPGEDPGFQAVVGRSEGAAAHEKAHDPADSESAEAQAAADPQGSDVTMAAQDRQVDEIEQQPVGEFDAKAFKEKLMAKIAESAPSTLEEADEFEENNRIDEVKGEVSGQVSEEKQEAEEQIEEKTDEQPDESGIAPKEVQPLPETDAGPPPPSIGAADAAPKPRSDAEVVTPLQENSQSLDQQMAEAEVTEEQLQKSNEPSFNQALDAKKEAQQDAVERPQEFRQEEQAALTQAQGEAEMTAEQQADGTRQERMQLLEQVFGIQGESKTSDETERRKVADEIADIYQKTKDEVEQILTDLDDWVTNEFDQKADAAQQHFEQVVGDLMREYKQDRYLSDPAGLVRWASDKIMGLPPEVNAFYEKGRDAYLKDMDVALDGIAAHVSTELNRAKGRVAQGRQEIQEYVTKLPASLQEVGQEAAGQIQAKFDDLEQTVVDKQDELIDSLAQKYNEKLEEVNARIEEMKLENSGLINQAKVAIEGVINTILELKAMLESMLARAAGAVQMIIKDPIKFLGNLIEGVTMGLQNFVSNIGTHLQSGLLSWLTGAVGAAGLRMPAQLDLPGIFDLVMQVLGLTYENIRAQLVQALGAKGEAIVGALEQTWEVLQIIRSEGMAGLWQYVQGVVGDLYAMVMDQIKEMIASEVIKAGIQWLIGILGGPAGAFIKAAQGIIKVVMWFIENGSRMMSLVNAIIDSVSAIASGALGQAAGFIENSLAKALPLAISFLADLLGLGGISRRVSGIIREARTPVNKGIAWLVKQVKAMAKKLGKLLGFGKKEAGQAGEEEEDQDRDQRWNAGIAAVQSLPEQSRDEIGSSLGGIKAQYGFDVLQPIDAGGQWNVNAVMRKTGTASVKKKSDKNPISQEEKAIVKQYKSRFPSTTLDEDCIIRNIRNGKVINERTGRFIDKQTQDYNYKAQYKEDSKTAHKHDSKTAQKIREERQFNLEEARKLELKGDDKSKEAAKDYRQKVRECSKKIGEDTGKKAMEERYRQAKMKSELFYSGDGKSDLDSIYKLSDGSFDVLEHKGGQSFLGGRTVENGEKAQQGTGKYLESVIASMHANGNNKEKKEVARQLQEAINNGKVRYYHTKTSIPEDGTDMTTEIEEFDMREHYKKRKLPNKKPFK